jgi:type I restriction enzyme S subunit
VSGKRKRKDAKTSNQQTSDQQTSEVFKTSEVSEIQPAPHELPDGWMWTTLDRLGAKQKNAIVDGPFGSNLKVEDYIEDRSGIPVLTTKNLNGDYSPESVRYISQTKFEELKRSEVKGGDIIVAKIGSCGKTGIYPQNMRSAIIPANLLKMTVDASTDRDYVFYYLNSATFQDQLKVIISATAQPAFSVSKFKKLLAPLPPLPEQRRIVAKIEQLFAESRTAREALERVPPLLKRFRQSVLAAAFRGQLTERDPNDEPASALLERIRAQRVQRLPKSPRFRKSGSHWKWPDFS